MKVLFISGYTDSLVLRHDLLDAEYVMLRKPFDGTMLAAKVRELLDQSVELTAARAAWAPRTQRPLHLARLCLAGHDKLGPLCTRSFSAISA